MLHPSCWLFTWPHHSILAQPVPVEKFPLAMLAKLCMCRLTIHLPKALLEHPVNTTHWRMDGCFLVTPYLVPHTLRTYASPYTVKWVLWGDCYRAVIPQLKVIVLHEYTGKSGMNVCHSYTIIVLVLQHLPVIFQHLPVVLQHVTLVLQNCNTYVLYCVGILCGTFHLVYAL